MAYLDKEILDKIKGYKFFVYLRKSSEDSEDRQIASLPRQTHEVEDQLINKYSLKITKASSDKPYYEESKSAYKEGRPGFNEMLQRIRSGEADGIIVWHANRLSRNYGDGGNLVQMVSDGLIKIVIACQGSYENNPRDLEYLMTEFTRATRDSGEKSEAVKSGNRDRFFDRKLWNGIAKPGYLNAENPITKERIIIEDKERLPMLTKAIRLILSGNSTPMEALNVLNNKFHYRTRKTTRQGGRPMSKSGWYKFLADPYLYGLMVRKEGEQRFEGKTVLNTEEFERLQIMIGRKGKPRISKHEFAYKPVLKCGGCRGSVTADEHWQIICPVCKTKFHKGKITTKCKNCGTLIENMKNLKLLHYIHYCCAKKTTPNCTEKSIRLEVLEKQIDQELQKYEIPETFRSWAIEYLNELNNSEVKDREIIRNNAKEAYDDCVKKLDNLLNLKICPQNVDGSVISDEEYSKRRQALMSEKEDLLLKTNETNERINNWLELSEKTFNFACYARHAFATGDLKTKTQILGALGSDLLIKDKNLQVSGMKHWFLIEKGKEDLVTLAKKLEPTKWMELLGQKDLPEVFRSTWLRVRDSNPDIQIQNLQSCR
jgi:site-specific DNA recombinase